MLCIHVVCFLLPERQEEQVLRTAPTGPNSIRLTWRYIQSSQGYRLEWREGEGQVQAHFTCVGMQQLTG